jgi:SWIM zinc finger domain protein
MKKLIGFFDTENKQPQVEPLSVSPLPETPIKSLVHIRFPDGRKLAYYNDRFALNCGDVVYVSGKLSGTAGIVVEVTTKFRIHTSDYEKVLSCLDLTIHGSFVSVADKMVSQGDIAIRPTRFESWVVPPTQKKHEEEEEDEIISGEGYTIDLESIGTAEGMQQAILERALDYCSEGKVAYVSVCNGVGTAFVDGTKWYRVDFQLENGVMRDVFCDCPYSGLCKHEVAVAITLQALMKQERIADFDNFVALDRNLFWKLVSRADEITI